MRWVVRMRISGSYMNQGASYMTQVLRMRNRCFEYETTECKQQPGGRTRPGGSSARRGVRGRAGAARVRIPEHVAHPLLGVLIARLP
ncbi:hypothetical protein BH20ACI3_BH20ACI3_24400 [soil metagenome]